MPTKSISPQKPSDLIRDIKPFDPNKDLFGKQSDNLIPEVIKVDENNSEIPRLNQLKDQYKRAALIAKKGGQQTIALSHIKTAKVWIIIEIFFTKQITK